MDWKCGLSSRALESPEFKPQSHQQNKTKLNKKRITWGELKNYILINILIQQIYPFPNFKLD
jgi:hypothetical protein